MLAVGTGLPEIVSGIIVTRKGKGDMAISNSIGSNIFDILICLALPWFISTVKIDPNSFVKIYSGGLTYSVIILLSTVIALMVIVFASKFALTKKNWNFSFVSMDYCNCYTMFIRIRYIW